ncbi:MAG: type II toxin-antitoxin system RelE/ParE family toxin [Actinomycetota bacterium]|nr:type II toxin-antitoxin system RelE/ParE family toxin [Actinomycetota bacterium]MCL6092530.1 type II toxin-antitoxin system RelE/ParE family toxin [Actinomycetota bacterium]MDA8167541.1 type II toxin-antitoxin system RelE/ParE family toxin [Actinomycetota bacterium]
MTGVEKPLVWLHGEVRTPPFSQDARVEAGHYLRLLQKGKNLSLPMSRPMPNIGTRCHEIKINDEDVTWRIVYRIDNDAILILEVFSKKTQQTPKNIIDICKKRIGQYDHLS